MFAEATLKGLVDERIWRYDNTTYFRLKVAGRACEASGLFTVALPKNVSRSMPRPAGSILKPNTISSRRLNCMRQRFPQEPPYAPLSAYCIEM
jgi:hypothetical protein